MGGYSGIWVGSRCVCSVRIVLFVRRWLMFADWELFQRDKHRAKLELPWSRGIP